MNEEPSENAAIAAPAAPPELSDAQCTAVVEGLAYAMRPIRLGAAEVTREYRLGPRGTAILALIALDIHFPTEIAKVLKISISLCSTEIGYLTRAGLIAAETGSQDRRRSRLRLTDAGESAYARVRTETLRLVRRNLAAFTLDQIDLFARMLQHVSRIDDDNSLLRRRRRG